MLSIQRRASNFCVAQGDKRLPEGGPPHRETDEAGHAPSDSQPGTNVLLVLTVPEHDTAHV